VRAFLSVLAECLGLDGDVVDSQFPFGAGHATWVGATTEGLAAGDEVPDWTIAGDPFDHVGEVAGTHHANW
jgi:hypothetical protein